MHVWDGPDWTSLRGTKIQNLTTCYIHMGGLKNYLCLDASPSESDSTALGCVLSTRSLQTFPGASNMYQEQEQVFWSSGSLPAGEPGFLDRVPSLPLRNSLLPLSICSTQKNFVFLPWKWTNHNKWKEISDYYIQAADNHQQRYISGLCKRLSRHVLDWKQRHALPVNLWVKVHPYLSFGLKGKPGTTVVVALTV